MNSKYSKHHQLYHLYREYWSYSILTRLKFFWTYGTTLLRCHLILRCQCTHQQFQLDVHPHEYNVTEKIEKQYFPTLLLDIANVFTSIRMHKEPVASYAKELKDPFDREQRIPQSCRESIWGFCATDALLSVLIGIFILWKNVSLSTFVEIPSPNKRKGIKRNILCIIDYI